MGKKQRYAIGQQDFAMMRKSGNVYVDKTEYIEKIEDDGSQYYFLARPRRFGKSLFLSMLRYFYEGRRDLFEGLYIDTVDYDWEEYPVLILDLNTDRFKTPEGLKDVLENMFQEWEKEYEVTTSALTFAQRFRNIIKAAYEKTGMPVVILVDEYDKPLTNNLANDDLFEVFQAELASIYSNFKSSAEYIKLVSITGISRFSKLSVFSDLNNLRDITFSEEYSDICGITESELQQYFQKGIERFADHEELTYEEACQKLKLNYDGYRFTRSGSDIYNPWSVLSALQELTIDDYWVRSGNPSIVVESMRDHDVDIKRILNTECTLGELQGLDLRNADPLSMLYQIGYLTIKAYDKSTCLYRLGLPNKEVTRGLFDVMLPYYITVNRDTPESVARNIITSILKGEPERLMENIDVFLAGIPYDMKMEDENNFHNALYILLTLIGARVETEVHTSDGRIDLVIKTSKFIYIIELKFNKDSESAMAQIKEKEYDRGFSNDPRRIFRIGANFNKAKRRMDPPLIESY